MAAIPAQYSLLLLLAMVTTPITSRATQPTFQGSRQSCHEEGINYQGRKGSSVVPGVTSWTECSALCDAKPECNAWSWVKEDTGIYALNCALMEGFSNRAPDTNTVTGPKGCKDSSQTSASSAALSLPGGCQQYWYNWYNKCQDRSDRKVVPEAKSWQECWNACTRTRGCQVWSYAFQCELVGSFTDREASTTTTTTTTTTTSTTTADTNTITTAEDTSSNTNPEWTLVNPSERLYFN